MSKRTKITWTLFALTLLPAAGGAQFGSPCEVADNGTGTVNLPP